MPVVSYVAASVAVGLVLIRIYREWKWGSCKDTSSLKGKVFLITGANSGVGLETAKQLLKREATVIMGNRDSERTKEAIQVIRKFTDAGEIITYKLDLASFASIRQFAAEVNKNHSKIDVLINNAGLSVPLENPSRTVEKFELNIGVNHLGHFLLTNLLLKKLKESAPARIVIIASTLHEKGQVDEGFLEDMNLEKLRASGYKSRISPGYCNSKLANVYHGRELAERMAKDGIDVRLVCPGFTYTGLFRYSGLRWFHYVLFAPIAFFFLRSAWKGSQTIVYCATVRNLPGKSGDFYRDCAVYQSKKRFDDNIQKKLWEKSLQITSAQ